MAKYRSEAWKKAISDSKVMREWRSDRVGDLKAAFAWGANVSDACIHAKIHRDTYYKWVKRYPELSDIFEAAQNSLVLLAYQRHATAVVTDPAYARDYLRLKRPDEYRMPKTQIELSGKVEGDTDPALTAALQESEREAIKKLNREANKDDL